MTFEFSPLVNVLAPKTCEGLIRKLLASHLVLISVFLYRYLPLLGATFCFPQSLGILGGRPGASTYIIGMQEENAFYLDPHDVQQV